MAAMSQREVLRAIAENINWHGDDGRRDGVLDGIDAGWPAAPAEPEPEPADDGQAEGSSVPVGSLAATSRRSRRETTARL